MTTLHDHLNRPLPRPLAILGNPNPSTSRKQWTEVYQCGTWSPQAYNFATLEQFANFGPRNEADTARERLPFSMNQYPMILTSEDDVRSNFAKFVDHYVQCVWYGQGVQIRNGIGPPDNLPDASMTVDIMFQMTAHSNDRTAMVVGELKKPGVIDAVQWRAGPTMASQPTRKLAREMRAYAHQYNCHEVFVFDGITYLGLRSCCGSRDEIRTCEMKAWILPCTSAQPNVTVRQFLNFQVRSGYQRLRAKQSNDHNRTIVLNHRLLRQYWDGQVFWQDIRTGQYKWGHPDLTKTLDEEGDWIWDDDEGDTLHHEVGAYIS